MDNSIGGPGLGGPGFGGPGLGSPDFGGPGFGIGGAVNPGFVGGGAGLGLDSNFDRFDNSLVGFELNGNGFPDSGFGDFSSFDARLNAIAQGQGGLVSSGGAIGQGISGILLKDVCF